MISLCEACEYSIKAAVCVQYAITVVPDEQGRAMPAPFHLYRRVELDDS